MTAAVIGIVFRIIFGGAGLVGDEQVLLALPELDVALLVGLELLRPLGPVQRSLGPLRRMLVLPLPVLLRLPVSLMQARLLPGQLLWIFYLLCSPIMAALSRALIALMADRWI